ncbi:MAG: hypothetical protein FJ137_14415 [Deltaproteobacteria bacterium]|nr:hypothetical protein [Deltaproteobacteria bacterium]
MSVRHVGGGGGGGGGRSYAAGDAPRQQQVGVRDLPAEAQRAHELLVALAEVDRGARAKVLGAAGAREPLSPGGLGAVAGLYARLEMPLNPAGIARFKAERGLVGGSSLAGPVALAYARALEGGEVLFRLERDEELGLRPADRACLQFLRSWAKARGAEAMGRLKEALDLGNPPVGPDAAALANEYVGVNTVREVSKATSTRNLPLTDAGLQTLVEQREAEKSAKKATDDKAAAQAAQRAERLAARGASGEPVTATGLRRR